MKLNYIIQVSLVLFVSLITPDLYAQTPEKGWLNLPGTPGAPAALDDALQVMAEEEELSVFKAIEHFFAGDFRLTSSHSVEHLESEKALWAVVPLRIVESDQSDWVIWLEGQSALDLKMWLVDVNLNVIENYHTGAAQPYKSRPVDERRFALPISLRTQGDFYIVFRMTLPGSSLIGFRLSTIEELMEIGSYDALIRSIYVGLGLMMMFYSLFLAWVIRRKEYFLYALYVGCILLASLGDSELPHRYLWPLAGELNVRLPFFASLFSGFVASFFIAKLLDIKTQSTRLWRLFQCGMAIALLSSCVVPFLEIQTGIWFSMYWGSLLTLILVSVCLDRAIRGSALAGLLSCGWAAQLLGIGLLVSHSNGMQPEVFWLDYAFLIGSSLEMIFFSLAIPVGLGGVIRDRDAMLAELESVSQRYEEALESVTIAEIEIKSLGKLLEQEHYDLQKLTKGYERALSSLGKAEQKLAQAEKLASLGQLIVGVSDDLGTKAGCVLVAARELSVAMDGLVGSAGLGEGSHGAQAVELRETFEAMRRMLGFLEKGAHSIQRMNKALSHYAGGEDEEIADLVLAEVCEDIRLIVYGRIRQHTFEQNIPADLRVMARRSDVERVLGNLLTNASDAISDLPPELQADEALGRIRLSATTASKDSKEWVLIEVEDTGGGIADENRAEVLLPFMTTKTLHRGTGLGLFTAESILREHGGYIEIGTSQSMGGAKISLWFPVLT